MIVNGKASKVDDSARSIGLKTFSRILLFFSVKGVLFTIWSDKLFEFQVKLIVVTATGAAWSGTAAAATGTATAVVRTLTPEKTINLSFCWLCFVGCIYNVINIEDFFALKH